MKSYYFLSVTVPSYIVGQDTERDGGGDTGNPQTQESRSDTHGPKETEDAIQDRTVASANVRCPYVFSWSGNRKTAQRFLKEKENKNLPSPRTTICWRI